MQVDKPPGANTPMGQILEKQLLSPSNNVKQRHPSGNDKDSFMSRFRARSNSDSKAKSPRKMLQKQVTINFLLVDKILNTMSFCSHLIILRKL